MLIKLLVKEGPRKGDEFAIKGDVVIGRSRAEMSLKDKRVSSEHAKIYVNKNKNGFEIKDLGSSNGTLLNSVRLEKNKPIELKVGDIIVLGQTHLEVTELSGESPLEPGSWQADVDKALIQAMDFYEHNPPPMQNFETFGKPLCLEVVKGPDLGERFFYSFGPRKFGLHCSDGFLLADDLPPIAFELVPDKGRCKLVSHSKRVFLNSETFDSKILEPGDLISVGQTEFVVKFVDL